jgi:hypothetical protein
MASSYKLLLDYMNEANILSMAYRKSERYYRNLYNYLTYPVILTSTLSAVSSGLGVNRYILLGLSLTTLLITGFNSALNPANKEKLANQVGIEFGEIASNVRQFVQENSKTETEIKAYSQLIHELINTWQALAPPLKETYIVQARSEVAVRIRSLKKKHTQRVQS